MKNSNVIVAIIAGVVIFGAAIYFFTRDEVADQQADMENTDLVVATTTVDADTDGVTNTPNTTTPTTPAISAVMLSENNPGPVMDVQYANVIQDGFIALYSVDSRGEVSLVGASDLLKADIYQNIKIQTSTSMIQDQSLVAVLFADTNGDGKFTPQVDDQAVRVSGVVVTDIDIVGRVTTAETPARLAEVQAAIVENMNE